MIKMQILDEHEAPLMRGVEVCFYTMQANPPLPIHIPNAPPPERGALIALISK